ncbi:MAG TPA: hypothetical protein VMD03_05050 [Steroidobacteraceae bacterium]|nr:hypothetical protein [Steroidobacteraceae bacterium]
MRNRVGSKSSAATKEPQAAGDVTATTDLAATAARARLRVEVAKQNVRLAKEEMKRARKRYKEAKREAKRARRRAAATHKALKRARRKSGRDTSAAPGKVRRKARTPQR